MLGCQPLNEVVAVPPVLSAVLVYTALGMSCTAGVHIGNRITLVTPVSRIRRFKFGHAGNRTWRYSHDLPFRHSLSRPLAIVTPGANGGENEVCFWVGYLSV